MDIKVLEQNTDRTWFAIGVALVTIIILLFVNNQFPGIFAGVLDGFKTEAVSEETVVAEPDFTKVVIPYDITYTTDPSKIRDGKNGSKLVYDNDREDQILEAPITRIALYPYNASVVPFQTQTKNNPDQPQGYSKVIQKGVNGTTYTFYDPFTNKNVGEYTAIAKKYVVEIIDKGTAPLQSIPFDVEYTLDSNQVRAGVAGQKYVDSKGVSHITKQPISQRILYAIRTENIPFQTTRRANRDMDTGTERVAVAGVVGQKKVHYDPDTNKVTKEDVIRQPVTQIIEYGTRQTKSVPFGVDYTMDDSKVRPGKVGSKYVYSDGSEKIFTQPVTEFKKYPYNTKAISYGAENRTSNNRLTTENVIVQKGVNGQKRVFFDPRTNRDIGQEKITHNPVNQIREVGTINAKWFAGRELKFAYNAWYLHSFTRASWDDKRYGDQEIPRHTIVGTIVDYVQVPGSDSYQYEFKKSNGQKRYISTNGTYMRVKAALQSKSNGLKYYSDTNLTSARGTLNSGSKINEVVSLFKNSRGNYVYEVRNTVDKGNESSFNTTSYITADPTKVQIVNPSSFGGVK